MRLQNSSCDRLAIGGDFECWRSRRQPFKAPKKRQKNHFVSRKIGHESQNQACRNSCDCILGCGKNGKGMARGIFFDKFDSFINPLVPRNRAGEIRTLDLLNPIQALYQAEPRPDNRQRHSLAEPGTSRTNMRNAGCFVSTLRAGGGYKVGHDKHDRSRTGRGADKDLGCRGRMPFREPQDGGGRFPRRPRCHLAGAFGAGQSA